MTNAKLTPIYQFFFWVLFSSMSCHAVNGFVMGGVIGAVLANWGKPIVRERSIFETASGFAIGALSGAVIDELGGTSIDYDAIVMTSGSLAVAGGVLGGLSSFYQSSSSSVGKSIWDGFSLGAMVPGSIIGGMTGATLAIAWGGVRHEFTSQQVAGITSAGLFTGGAVNYLMSGLSIGQWVHPIGGVIGGLGMGYNLVQTGLDGYRQSKSVFGPDYETHATISRFMADSNGKGPALLVGYAKEANDYFLSAGNAEFRDLQNNWSGVFNRKVRY